jgi:UDP-glucuronate decarboxylase
MRPDDGRVVSNFTVQALSNRPITIYGTGKQTRSFCYVEDFITGLNRLMETSNDVTGPINLGNPGEFTMLKLAKLVLELTGSSSKIKFLPLPVDYPEHRRRDIAAAKSALDWELNTQLREGLGQTIAYFDELLASGSGSPLAAE